jgi:hypothetical protein
MYQSGQLELRTSALLSQHTSDRPSFTVTIRRGWGGPRQFQVFLMQDGLLFLDRRDEKEQREFTGRQRAVFAGAILGGAIGGLIAAMLVKPKTIPAKRETGLDLLTDVELLELATARPKSFVIKHEEILSIAADPVGAWDQMVGHRTLSGRAHLDTLSHGKLTLEFRDPAALSTAIEALPRRYAERVTVNVEFDTRRKRFVPRKYV